MVIAEHQIKHEALLSVVPCVTAQLHAPETGLD